MQPKSPVHAPEGPSLRPNGTRLRVFIELEEQRRAEWAAYGQAIKTLIEAITAASVPFHAV